MMWVLLFLAALIAIPMVVELRRNTMNDTHRGSASGQFVEMSKGVTHFTWYGPQDGPVLVCVHGLTTPSFVWLGLVRGFVAMGFRVLTYDLYGRGYSDRPAGRQDAALSVDQLDELLLNQSVKDDLTVVGYSMGGAISTAFAAANPDRLRQLILIASAGMAHNPSAVGRFIIRTRVIGDWLMLALYPSILRKGHRAEAKLKTSVPNVTQLQANELEFRGFLPAVLASLRGILSESFKDRHSLLHEEHLPVLAVWGQEDDVIPLTAVGLLAEWNHDAQQEVIDGAGHSLAYTHTDEVMAVIRDWIAQIEVTT